MFFALKHNGTTYYYVTNLQGDVLRILDETGTTVAAYTYDPWGKLLSATGTLAGTNRQIRRRTIRCPRKKLFTQSNYYWESVLCIDTHF